MMERPMRRYAMSWQLGPIGCLLIAAGALILFGLVIAVLLRGLAWAVELLYPLAQGVAALGAAALVLFLLPSSLFRSNRRWCGRWVIYVSYSWGVALWMWATLVLYQLWGILGLFLGLILLGIGSVPMACIAALLSGEVEVFGLLILATLVVFATRQLGVWIISKGYPELLRYGDY